MKLEENETKKIVGGTSITGSIVNYLTNLVKAFYSFGQAVGGGARRIVTKKTCTISR